MEEKVKSKRFVVVINNDIKGERVAVPCADMQAAQDLLTLKLMLHFTGGEAFTVNPTEPDHSEYLIESIEPGKVWIRIFILQEGDEGVWLGFSSGDRDNFVAPLPNVAPEHWGSADAYLFRTVGRSTNSTVEVSEVK